MEGTKMDMEFQATTFDQLGELHGTVKELIRKSGPMGGKTVEVSDLTDLLGKLSELQENFAPEEVEVHKEPATDGAPALGWVIMGGLSVALTRSTTDGVLAVSLENIAEGGAPLRVRVDELQSGRSLFDGKVG